MKTMLITGASSGIGRALAIRAARAGYAVYAVGRNADALEALRAKIQSEHGFVAVEATDVALPANARGIVARALAQFGTIDVLVNNAGFVSAGELSAQSDAELQRQFGTHVIGPVALVREARDALRSVRGQVFILGSGVARVPVGALGAYPPAKAAVRSATAILRRELRPHGIGVTYVDPGAVDTPFMKRAGMPGAPSLLLVSPEHVARKILINVERRPRELNAVGWQTTLVGCAEFFPRIVDALLARAPGLVGGGGGAPSSRSAASPPRDAALPAPGLNTALPAAADAAALALVAPPETGDGPAAQSDAATAADGATGDEPSFETALEPHRRRMEKLSLRESFVRGLLVPGAHLDLGEIALRWAGMPNKNERAITEDVLEALADAAFLKRTEDHGYRVMRAP
jgi:short-subunit dehydrogenase